MGKVVQVVLAIVLALTWSWTDVLLQKQIINDEQRLWILIGLTALLALQQVILVIPEPAKRSVIEQREQVVAPYLRNFLTQCYKMLTEEYSLEGSHRAKPIVRVNIMLPTKKFRGIFGAHLQIYYVACLKDVVYSEEEKTVKWYKGNGAAGGAWKNQRATPFDSRRRELRLPLNSLTQEQTEIARSIKSTLSIPIWSDNAVVGILNLDSKRNINETLFLNERISTLARACANVLAGQFFRDGVEG